MEPTLPPQALDTERDVCGGAIAVVIREDEQLDAVVKRARGLQMDIWTNGTRSVLSPRQLRGFIRIGKRQSGHRAP